MPDREGRFARSRLNKIKRIRPPPSACSGSSSPRRHYSRTTARLTGQMKQGRVFTRSIGTSDFSNATPCIAQTAGVDSFFTHFSAIVGILSRANASPSARLNQILRWMPRVYGNRGSVPENTKLGRKAGAPPTNLGAPFMTLSLSWVGSATPNTQSGKLDTPRIIQVRKNSSAALVPGTGFPWYNDQPRAISLLACSLLWQVAWNQEDDV
jgi:hypothetical protein